MSTDQTKPHDGWAHVQPKAPEAPIYVVVCANDKPHPRYGVDPDGPLVLETYTRKSTLKFTRERASAFEKYGACRVGRIVFEDVDGSAL